MEKTADKIQAIETLWLELRKTKPHTLEYEMILKKIGRISAEYAAVRGVKNGSASRQLPG